MEKKLIFFLKFFKVSQLLIKLKKKKSKINIDRKKKKSSKLHFTCCEIYIFPDALGVNYRTDKESVREGGSSRARRINNYIYNNIIQRYSVRHINHFGLIMKTRVTQIMNALLRYIRWINGFELSYYWLVPWTDRQIYLC